MVQAIINLEEHEARILNIVKGKFGLKNKSEAIKLVIDKFEECLEPEIRPEYAEKLGKIRKQETIPIGSTANFKKRYGLK